MRVLFLCLGNICRSPMAEAIFREMLAKRGLSDKVHVDSAGLGDWHVGDAPHHGTRRVLDEHGISYEGIQSRQVTKAELSSYDYVIAMDSQNMEGLKRLGATDSKRVFRLLELLEDESDKDVPDPYFDGRFDNVYGLLTRGCEALVRRIEQDLERQ